MVDPRSFASHCLIMYSYSQHVGTGTGFIVNIDDIYLLITNYHVLSGRHPDTGKQLPEAAALPDRVLLPLLHRYSNTPSWTYIVVDLDLNGYPTWICHPTLGRSFDVVALPIKITNDYHVIAYSREPGPDIAVQPSSDVAIIGFPEGMTAPGLTAIWKSGSVASEPEFTLGEDAFFWIDSNTRPGMSGSPVVARRFGGALMTDGSYSVHNGPVDRVLGVYSGRALDAPDMTLGRVWKWDGVQAVIDEAVRQVRRGIVQPKLSRLAHYPQLDKNMVKIEVQRTADVPARMPDGSIEMQPVALSQVIREIVLIDNRFGLNLDSVRMAAAIDAALQSAIDNGENLELEDKQYAIVREIINSPSNPYNPSLARFILPLLEHVLNAGTHNTPSL